MLTLPVSAQRSKIPPGKGAILLPVIFTMDNIYHHHHHHHHHHHAEVVMRRDERLVLFLSIDTAGDYRMDGWQKQYDCGKKRGKGGGGRGGEREGRELDIHPPTTHLTELGRVGGRGVFVPECS